MTTKNNDQFGLKFWLISASIIIVIAGLKIASSIVTPFLLALVISAVCLGPFVWLKEKGVSEGLTVVIIMAGIVLISFSIIALFGSSLDKFADKAPFYGEKITQYWEGINNWLAQIGLFHEESLLAEGIQPGKIMLLAGDVFSSLSSLVSNSILIILTVVFFLLEITLLNTKMEIIKPSSLSGIDNVIRSIKKYFGTKTITSLATGIFIAIGLAIVGVDFPILWGFLAFLLNFIPNIGSTIAAIPAVLLALVQIGPGSAGIVTVMYLVINGLIGNVIEPKIMGKNLGLSTLVVFVSLIFWGWVLGTVGMLLSTPLTIVIKLILDNMDETKKLGLLLGDQSSLASWK